MTSPIILTPKRHLVARQHGFLAKHSTCSQLLESVNKWSIALKNCNIVDVVYFDIAKAFDPLSHLKLIHKLFFSGHTLVGVMFERLSPAEITCVFLF